jgi:hypothetical protein
VKRAAKPKSIFPKGWDGRRVKRVIAHYDRQSEEDAVREYLGTERAPSQTLMTVPTKLVPVIRAFIASTTAKPKAAGSAAPRQRKRALV